MKGDRLTDAERCRAMAMRTGNRCPFRATGEGLCKRHTESGAIVPDEWTQPDNLPVFYVRAAVNGLRS